MVLADDGAALAFGRWYLASLQERNPFTESGPICMEIDASIPGLAKQGNLLAIRQTGASELSEYTVTKLDGDSFGKAAGHRATSPLRSEQKQFRILPSQLRPRTINSVTRGTFADDKGWVCVFQIVPRKKREGLVRGEIWIDSATGFAVRQAGRFVKRPSVFIRDLYVTRDVNLLYGVPATRVTHLAIRTVLLGRIELTITERPLRADDRELQMPKNFP